MSNYHFFVEFEWKSIGGLEIPVSFYERGFCEKSATNSIKFKVTGLLEYNNDFFIIFPKGMNIPSDFREKIFNARTLLKVLDKYASTMELDEDESVWLGKHESSNSFEIAKWIAEDYKRNGLIHTSKRIQQLNSNGRIEWSKSIQKIQPLVFKQKIYYVDLITSKNDVATDQEVTIIHSIVLSYIMKQYGWVIELNYTYNSNKYNYSIDYMIYIIKKALKSTNVDREIQLFKNMLSFLQKKTNKEVFNVYATAYFANIWETMCAKLMNDDKSLHKIMPNPYWFYNESKTYTSQIPDIITNFENQLIVLDAKYYQLKLGAKKLPGWPDIVKQLFYAMSIHNSKIKVHNAFLFPYSCVNGFEYLGYAAVEDKEETFGKVFAFGLDVSLVLRNYLNHSIDSKGYLVKRNLLLQLKEL